MGPAIIELYAILERFVFRETVNHLTDRFQSKIINRFLERRSLMDLALVLRELEQFCHDSVTRISIN